MTKLSKEEKLGIAGIFIVALIIAITVFFVFRERINIADISKNTKHLGLVKIEDIHKSASEGVHKVKGQIAEIVTEKPKVSTESITFKTNEYKLDKEQQSKLTLITDSCKLHKTVISIKGYADSTGSDQINIPLSIKRAKTVKQFLLDNGCTEIVDMGYGSEGISEKQVDIKIERFN